MTNIPDNIPTIVPTITAARKSRYLSAHALSKRLGKSPNYIGQIERGEYTPSLSALEEIFKELSLTVSRIPPPSRYTSEGASETQ